jgi:hypothetical protein
MNAQGAETTPATAERERVYTLEIIEPGPLGGDYRKQVQRWIEAFEPLEPFEAGTKAKLWLQTNLETENLPHRTYLVFNDEDPNQLFGFFVIDSLDVQVSPGDVPIMQVRHAIKDPQAPTQPATKLVWIARHKDSPPGIGAEMFEYALYVAEEAGSCALMVDAYDQTTAEELWIKRFDLRQPRAGASEWSCLWHTVGEPDQTFC